MLVRKRRESSVSRQHFFIYCGFLTVLLAFPCWVFGVAPHGHKTVFRYRSYVGARPDWVSPHYSAGEIEHSYSGDIIPLYRGDGFELLEVTDFNGATEYIRAADAISTVDDADHDSFTIQAWFMAHNVAGTRCLLSNMHAYNGFSLKIINGELRGSMRLENNGSVNKDITGGTIDPDKWYYVAFRVKENADTYDMRLFVNGVQVHEKVVDHYDGIRPSSEHPMVAAEPGNGDALGEFFQGYIYAVSITNYAVEVLDYLANEAIRDGSRYFGMISYHDYLSTTKGPDYRIHDTIEKYPEVADYVQQRFHCPFMNDEYVPQGVATNGADLLYLTMYHKTTAGTLGSHPSILVEVTADGHLRRVMQLQELDGDGWHKGHVGGVAYWDGHIYSPDGSNVLRYELNQAEEYYFDPETFNNPRGDQCPLPASAVYACILAGNDGISFLSAATDYDGTPILWTGQFEDDATPDLNIVGFAIEPDGTIAGDSPRHVYKLPVDKVQGVDCYESSPFQHKFYLATSYGDKPSKIYDVAYGRDEYTGGDPTEVDSYSEVFEGPAGFEDVGMIGGDLWCVSESGARHYQKRSSPWSDLFPFVFSCRFRWDEDFETNDFSKYPWSHSGDADWRVVASDYHLGEHAAQAGAIDNSQSSALQVTLSCSSGAITFWRKVESESDYDYLTFYIDDVPQGSWSGAEDWSHQSYPVAAGTRTFKWTYAKAIIVSTGADTAWIDDIVFPPLMMTVPSCWECPTHCHGDTDCDGDIDTVDWPILRDSFGAVYPETDYHPCADFDHDGYVDTVDWPPFRDKFGVTTLPADCPIGGTWPPGE